eukprot:scaffold6241_cov129-Cylindrotheca_fusiformis.AAC.12
MARITAQKAQIDISCITGTGDHGRVTLDDVKDVLYPLLSKPRGGLPFVLAPARTTTVTGRKVSSTPPFATPMARTAARNSNLDLTTIDGTGESGRITLDDVKSALKQRKESYSSSPQ